MKKLVRLFICYLWGMTLFFGGGLPNVNTKSRRDISEEWKKRITSQFNNDIKMIRQIIIEGEADKKERDDFFKIFDDQQKWLENTISGTKQFFDPHYNAVMQRKVSFNCLIKAQKKADQILSEFIEENKLNESKIKKVRLAILYEINDAIQQEVKSGVANLIDTGISDVDIRKIVTNIARDFKDQLIDVEKEIAKFIKDLNKKIKELKKDIDKKELEKAQIQEDLKNGLEKGKEEDNEEEKNKKIFELDDFLNKVQVALDRLEDQKQSRSDKLVDERLKKEVEEKNKENLRLQIKLRRIQRELQWLKDDLKELPSD